MVRNAENSLIDLFAYILLLRLELDSLMRLGSGRKRMVRTRSRVLGNGLLPGIFFTLSIAVTCLVMTLVLHSLPGAPSKDDAEMHVKRTHESISSPALNERAQPLSLLDGPLSLSHSSFFTMQAENRFKKNVNISFCLNPVDSHVNSKLKNKKGIYIWIFTEPQCGEDMDMHGTRLTNTGLRKSFSQRRDVKIVFAWPWNSAHSTDLIRKIDVVVLQDFYSDAVHAISRIRAVNPSCVIIFICLKPFRGFRYDIDVDILALNARIPELELRSKSALPVVMHLAAASNRYLFACSLNSSYSQNVAHVGDFSLAKLPYYYMLDEAIPFGLSIYGRGWETTQWGAYVREWFDHSDHQAVFCNSKIILSISSPLEIDLGALRWDTVEAIGANGGVVVTNHAPTLNAVVKVSLAPGNTSRFIADILASSSEHASLSDQAAAEASLRHTWDSRVDSLLLHALALRPGLPVRRHFGEQAIVDKPIRFCNETSVTNPSILIANGVIVIVGRKLTVLRTMNSHRATWVSEILASFLPTDALFQQLQSPASHLEIPVLLKSGHLGGPELCHAPQTKDLAFGPEDPRLLLTNGSLLALYTSRPVKEPVFSKCNQSFSMHAADLLLRGSPIGLRTPLSIIRYNPLLKDQKWVSDEKNWMPFLFAGKIHALTRIHPHEVRQISPVNGRSYRQSSRNLPHWMRTAKLGGGTQLIPVRLPPRLALLHFHQEALLGVFHAQIGSRQYQNFGVLLAAKPPFHVLQVSKVVPLVSRPRCFKKEESSSVSFATGLSASGSGFFISYGCGDCESRLAYFRQSDFFDSF